MQLNFSLAIVLLFLCNLLFKYTCMPLYHSPHVMKGWFGVPSFRASWWVIGVIFSSHVFWTLSKVSCSLTQDDYDDKAGGCLHKSQTSSEEFTMKLRLCRKNVSIGCEIGGSAVCHKDREMFKATAIVGKRMTKCLIEANTTELKYIKFVVKAKYLRNLNQEGSRSLTEDEPEPEVQRGKCTLGYTCVNNHHLHDIRVNCLAFHYDKSENPFNGTNKKFVWTAPQNYTGTVIFSSVIRVSQSFFFVDVETARISLPRE